MRDAWLGTLLKKAETSVLNAAVAVDQAPLSRWRYRET